MPESAAAPTADQTTVTVVGEGEASATPDTAQLQLGVETRGATPGEALEACSRALEEVITAVRAAGVQPPWLATGELSVHPDWVVRPPGCTGWRWSWATRQACWPPRGRRRGGMRAVGPSSMPRWPVSRSARSCGSRRWPVGDTR